MQEANSDLERKIAQLTQELGEARQQQAATADALKVISRSAFDLDTVLETLVGSAISLCEATRGVIWLRKGEQLFLAAHVNYSDEWVQFAQATPITPAADALTTSGIAAFTGEIVHVEDVPNDPRFRSLAAHRLGDYRAGLAVPLKRDGRVEGVISLSRPEARLFTDRQIALVQTFADQAVIAIENVRLFEQVQARTTELATALQQQTATADVLKVISRSAFDLKTVLDALAATATRVCEADKGCIMRREGDLFKFTANFGFSDALVEYANEHPLRAGSDSATARAAQEGRTVHIPDVLADQDYAASGYQKLAGYRTMLAVPLLREGAPIGVFILTRPEVKPFTQKQVELVESFADQAVIAMENVRLFEEVQAKTADLSETLEQQTATSEVLRVIAASPTDIQPVLKTVVESAARLCDAYDSLILLREGDSLVFGAHFGPIPFDFTSWPLERNWVSGRSVIDGETIHVADLASAGDEFAAGRAMAQRLGHRTILATPLLREGEAIGTIVLRRTEVRRFGEKQVELLKTFADQAVIAIENVRLFDEVQARNREVTEALEQQTATGAILRVIAASPTDIQPVLQVVAESATRFCDTHDAIILLEEDGMLAVKAHFGPIPLDERWSWPVSRDWVTGRAFIDRETVHVHDLASAPEYPLGRELALSAGHRTVVATPLMRDDTAIGALLIRRSEVRPFSERQIGLLRTFADQAVIAIENVRLFDEVQARNAQVTEALEQQTATGAILRVIAASPTDIQPVLQVVAESATRFCDTHDAIILLEERGMLAIKAHHGPMPLDARPWPVARDWVTGRAFIDRETVHVHDLTTADDYPLGQKLARITGHRTIVATPLMRDDEAIGALVIRRSEVRPFSERQIGLLKTFADQAVIAIENVRLFEEVQAKTADLQEALTFQKATSDVLEVIGRSASKLQPVLDIIVETASSLCRADMSTLRLLKDGAFHHAASNNSSNPALAEYSRRNAVVPDRSSVVGRVALEGRTIHIEDVLADSEYTYLNKLGHSPVRTTLGVPLIHEATVVGVIVLLRKEVSPFTDRQIELVRTFADQAVIALANVQLFEKLETRTDDLTRSLDDLRTAQDRLVQTEKLASLGQLTAGIAHEIKNPLNFVNNFSSLSVELIDELRDVLADAPLDEQQRADVTELTGLLKGNLDKVAQHGKRADSIVRNMLLHSREGSGEHRPAEINAVVEESLNLAYHGARAERQGFNITLQRDFDPLAGEVDLYPQEITRVLLNLISNSFYATVKRGVQANAGAYEPMLTASTRNLGDSVEIRIRDNGTGIPPEVKDKMFNPFFTTKPAGEGTGLGLSLSHDIIVKQHAGTIAVDTEPGAFTEFRIVLPRRAAAMGKTGGPA